jgi:hypothetical protein
MKTTAAAESGIKHDGDKPRLDLIDPYATEQIAHVLSFGARKYAEHNWRGGIKMSRLLGAAMRHLMARLRGEKYDLESGLPHLAHLGCCVMFALWMDEFRPDMDDIWKPGDPAPGSIVHDITEEELAGE